MTHDWFTSWNWSSRGFFGEKSPGATKVYFTYCAHCGAKEGASAPCPGRKRKDAGIA